MAARPGQENLPIPQHLASLIRDAEPDGVAEGVQLGTHPRLGVEHAGDATVHAVEDRGGTDEGEGEQRAPVDRIAGGAQSAAECQQRDQVGQEHDATTLLPRADGHVGLVVELGFEHVVEVRDVGHGAGVIDDPGGLAPRM